MKIAELYCKMQMVQKYLRACLYMNGMEGDAIREVWEKGITNDMDYFIEIEFENILITYDVEKKKVCDTFEVYDGEGIWLCVLNIYDYIKKEVE